MNRINKKYTFTSYLICFIILVFFGITSYTLAYTTDEKKKKLKELEKKEEQYKNLINLKKEEVSSIKIQVKELESQSKKLENNIRNNNEKVRNVESDIQKIKNKISQKTVVMSSQKELLKKILLSKYQTSSYEDNIRRLFSPSSIEAFNSKDRVEQTASKIHDMVIFIMEEQKILKKDISNLEVKKKDIRNVQFDLSEQNIHLENSKNYKSVLARQVSSEKLRLEDKLSDIKLQQLQVQNEINSLSSTQIGSFSLSDLPSKQDANLSRPVKKPYVVTQGYGKTSYSHHYKGGHHNGIDYGARGSKIIMSASEGIILATGNMGRYGYGKWVAIDHLNGLVTLYGHLSLISVTKGLKINKGDSIGIMGTTGFSTGVHLHFSIFAQKTFSIVESSKVKGIYIPSGGTVNPAMYL